jgi:hypothetical protein
MGVCVLSKGMKMEKANIPATITEARAKSGYNFVILGRDSNESNSRTLPYAELYRSRTSIMETPAEYIQKASEDETSRKIRSSKSRQR